jgi:hypothetical protein
MAYPNVDFWSALEDGITVDTGDQKIPLHVIDVGEIDLPSGKLTICDPFIISEDNGILFTAVPPGRYPIKVTMADFSDEDEPDHFREAYASMIIDADAKEVTRRIITPLPGGVIADAELNEDEEYDGFGVDAALACFVDAESFTKCMPEDWYDLVSDDDDPSSWFSMLDDENHIREDLANVPLINAQNGENIVLVHTGWGDGFFPIVGGFDKDGRLINVHIDFLVIAPDGDDDDAEEDDEDEA